MKRYRITISEEEIQDGKPARARIFSPIQKEKDIFQYLVEEKDFNLKSVLRTIVAGTEAGVPK